MNNLKEKKIIVTGASGGIGNSIVKRLSECGANILASGTRIEKLEEKMPEGDDDHESDHEEFEKKIEAIDERLIAIEDVLEIEPEEDEDEDEDKEDEDED